MQSEAAERGASVQLQIQDPDTGWRQFGCYMTWDDALARLGRLRRLKHHMFEVIAHGKPCKPYLDLDGVEVPAAFGGSIAAVVERADALVRQIFVNDYKIVLKPEDTVWLVSPNPAKMSLHLVVTTHDPQWVYSSNHQSDPRGASHLAQRIVALDPDLAPLIDVGVYTKDREMRAIGATKFGKPGSPLVPFTRPDVAPITSSRQALITCLDAEDRRSVIDVPQHIPRVVREERRALLTPREAAVRDDHTEYAEVVTRMLDLLHEGLHPSAYHDRSHGADAPFDPSHGVKFNFTNRSEPCYTSHVHDGTNNLRCWVDAAGDVHAKCFSARCADAPSRRLGPLRVESDAYLSGAVRVDMDYMVYDAAAARQPAEPRPAQPPEVDDGVATFSRAVERWLRGEARVLSVRSPMGTGKSTFLDALLTTLSADKPGLTALVVTYRQSLASEHARKLGAHGFVSYLKVSMHYELEILPPRGRGRPTKAELAKIKKEMTRGDPLADRVAYPRVICQIESLRRVAIDPFAIPEFDLVVLDEVESVLRHYASPTVKQPQYAMDSFVNLLKAAKRGVVTLDAAWGPATHEFLAKAGLSNILVVNDKPPKAPRTFAFTNDDAAWQAEILEDLVAGTNVVVVTLSAEMAYKVEKLVAAAGAVPEGRVLLHTSKSSDELRRQLDDVDTLWSKYQLVIYSPTIAAGVDFSTEHFGRMYCYTCANSALPSTALQMLFRVRKLGDTRVRCCAARAMRMSLVAARPSITSYDMRHWLLWMDLSLRPPGIQVRFQPVAQIVHIP